MIIAITGTNGSGKGTISNYLVQEYSFKHLSVRGFLTNILEQQNKPLTRNNMINLANQLREKYGSDYIIAQLLEQAKQYPNTIIESIRTVGEVETLKKESAILLAVDADIETRYGRISERGSSTDIVSFEDVKKLEQQEMQSNNPNEQNIQRCIEMADISLENNGTKEELLNELGRILREMGKEYKHPLS